MKAVCRILAVSLVAISLGCDECPEHTRECVTESGDSHCVGAISDCGGPGHTICRAIECSDEAFDMCTSLVDDEHCGECWRACPGGTYCNADRECVPTTRPME